MIRKLYVSKGPVDVTKTHAGSWEEHVRMSGGPLETGSARERKPEAGASLELSINREEGTMATGDRVGYWRRTKGLMITMMVLWAFFAFFIHFFVETLNKIVIFGFPLGFYMAAQGSLIAFVIMLFWFARKQNAIDEESGFAED
jgi:putative solute:sodium symporter small subunit